MFLHRLKPTIIKRYVFNKSMLATTTKRYNLTSLRPLTAQARLPHVIIPDTHEAEAIVPLLQQIKAEALPSSSATEYNAVLNTLALQGRSQQAQKLYDVIFRHHDVEADIDTYSQLMLAYMNDGKYEEAMEIYYELRDHDQDPAKNMRLKPDTYAAMFQALTDPNKIITTTTTTTTSTTQFDPSAEPIYEYSVADADTLIYTNIEGDSQPALLTALALFNDMRQLDIQPTPDMYSSLLKACADQKDGYVLEKIHKLIRMDLYFDPDVQVLYQLMRAYRAVGDAASVVEIWEVAESSNVVDRESAATVLETCLQHGYHSRADAIWNALGHKDICMTVDDFNVYLQCVLNSHDFDKAEKLLQEGLSTGQANETSVNILKRYNNYNK